MRSGLTTDSNFIINRPINEFKEHCLMIGCGYCKNHHFNFLSSPVNSARIHPPKLFYHVSLKSNYSDEGQLDVEGDFLNENLIRYLSQKKFKLICFEAVTEIFSNKTTMLESIENAKSLLTEDGICCIYFGGRDNPQQLYTAISSFTYSYSFTYGQNDTWSLLASNQPFELEKILDSNIYLNYMGNQVIKTKSNLIISYNYYENSIGRHLMTANPDDNRLLQVMNPFVINKMKKL